MPQLLIFIAIIVALVSTDASEQPQRGAPFKQPQEAAWPNPSTERKVSRTKVQPNGKGKTTEDPEVELGYVSCNDDLDWIYGDSSTDGPADVGRYLKSNEGSHCHCPRSGRWEGKMTNGTWFWDWDQADWEVSPGVGDKPPVVDGKGVMSATSIWEFWATDQAGKTSTGTGKPKAGERFWVSQEVTIWGQPQRGAEWVPETGDFQSSKKFAELSDDGKVMMDKNGKIYYKGSSMSVVFECQILYTDTLAPDRRDGGCKINPADGEGVPCGGSSDGGSESVSTEEAEEEEEATLSASGDPPGSDPTPPTPAGLSQFPHKMAWYMFLTASSGPCKLDGGEECPQGGPANNKDGVTFKTCDDVNKDAVDSETCPNRQPGASGYQWTPGINTCPDPRTGFDAAKNRQPLCPNCVPTTAYKGSDGGGKQSESHHGELGQQSASSGDIGQQGLPPCATKRDPETLDSNDEPWQNDYFSMCDFPLIASAQALPINGRYENEDSNTFHMNGTITVGPPQDLIGNGNAEQRDAHSRPPGYPGPTQANSAYDGIAGPANSLILCDGVFDHCTTDSESSSMMDCAYGHTKGFLGSLGSIPNNKDNKLGNVPLLLAGDAYSQQTFATLICVRNSWVKGNGYDPITQSEDSTFLKTCNDNSGKSGWMTGFDGASGAQNTACMKGGGWGWPFCPLNLPNAPAIEEEPSIFCYQEPQGTKIAGLKFQYLHCLSARFLPVSVVG